MTESHSQLCSRTPVAASLSSLTPSSVDHKDLLLQTSFPHPILCPSTQHQHTFLANTAAEQTREKGELGRHSPLPPHPQIQSPRLIPRSATEHLLPISSSPTPHPIYSVDSVDLPLLTSLLTCIIQAPIPAGTLCQHQRLLLLGKQAGCL